VFVPNVRRSQQIELFDLVMDYLEAMPDLINKLLEIEGDGIITVCPLAATGSL
jgi:hypothetical protein